MELDMDKRLQQLQARTRAANTVKVDHEAPTHVVQLLDSLVDSLLELVNKSADKGHWECEREFPALSDEELTTVAANLKLILSDVLIISNLGNKKVKVSWALTNEV